LTIELVFPGKPISKDNRATIAWAFSGRRRRRPVFRVPEKYKLWEDKTAAIALKQLVRDKRFPIKKPAPVEVWITFFYPYWPSQPDLHNSPKSFCDALNKVVWEDDSQIWDSHLKKRKDADNPRIELKLRIMDRKELT
jgi:Holliday junction resolvase RusA-like endonuclease